MTNVIGASYKVWTADTVGIISKTPIWITAIGVIPSSAAGTITLNYWDETAINTSSNLTLTATASSGTVTDDNASHDWLTAAAFPAGDVVQVLATTGAAGNKTYHLIGTAGNNDRIIITPTSTWADEANKTYSIQSFPSKLAFIGLTQATTAMDAWYPFPQPIRFPNLILGTATNAAVKIYLAQTF